MAESDTNHFMISQEMPAPAYIILPDGRRFDLQETKTIGRSQSNSVVINNEFIGREHPQIQVRDDGQCVLVDLQSRNGCSIDSRRVSGPCVLKDGDVIDMAGSLIEFHTKISLSPPTPADPTLHRIERKNCWLMIGDIVGFGILAQELPPEEIPRITGGWFNASCELIEKHGGQVNQYLGDGFFSYWYDDSPRAEGQILDTLRELARMQKEASPSFRVVLHYGEVILSTVPDTRTLQLHGTEVNFAFRMEKVASRFKDIQLCSEAALEKLGVKSLVRRESEVGSYEGVFSFHVPDLQLSETRS